MVVGVIVSSSNNKTGKIIHQAGSFHLIAEAFFRQRIPFFRVLDNTCSQKQWCHKPLSESSFAVCSDSLLLLDGACLPSLCRCSSLQYRRNHCNLRCSRVTVRCAEETIVLRALMDVLFPFGSLFHARILLTGCFQNFRDNDTLKLIFAFELD